jgi:hypothetical protein
LGYWNGLRGKGILPAWPGLDAPEIAAMSANVSYADVVEVDGSFRFLLRFQGTILAEALGRNGVGKFLDEILPSPYKEVAISTCRQAVVRKLPIYTVSDLRDRTGRIVHYERLLLPFSEDGVTVDRILASLEAISPEGDFDHRDMMKPPAKPPAFAFCTTIQH